MKNCKYELQGLNRWMVVVGVAAIAVGGYAENAKPTFES